MSEAEKPSFSRLVFARAVANTIQIFESRLRDAVYVLLSLAIGSALYYFHWGLPRAMTEALPVVMFSFAPLGIFVACVFLWHLLIAPAELSYEAAERAAQAGSSTASSRTMADPPRKEKTINWSVWRQRANYNLREFAAILAGVDPVIDSREPPGEVRTFLRLITEDVTTGKLPAMRGRRAENYYTPDLWPAYFEVTRATAINWAKGRGFDISKVE